MRQAVLDRPVEVADRLELRDDRSDLVLWTAQELSLFEIDLLVFFWDPLEPQPHDPDVKALLRIAVVWNIPIACNRASADFMISSPLMISDYERQMPNYQSYINRQIEPG